MDNLGKIIPSVVFEAVNYLLKEKYRGSSLSIKQDEIINKIISLNSSITRLIILKKYLDIERIYSDNGWEYHIKLLVIMKAIFFYFIFSN
jgi:hypothetical protein